MIHFREPDLGSTRSAVSYLVVDGGGVDNRHQHSPDDVRRVDNLGAEVVPHLVLKKKSVFVELGSITMLSRRRLKQCISSTALSLAFVPSDFKKKKRTLVLLYRLRYTKKLNK